MTKDQALERILSKSQIIYLYLCEHGPSTAAELRKASKAKNIAALVSQINDGFVVSNQIDAIHRGRNDKGRALYSLESQR